MRERPALCPITSELLKWCADDFTELFATWQIVKTDWLSMRPNERGKPPYPCWTS